MKMLSLVQKFVKTNQARLAARQADILLALFVILLSLASFGAGYLIARSQFGGDITIETYQNGTTK